MLSDPPFGASRAGRATRALQRNRKRRAATREDTPEVISSFCDGTTLVETVVGADRMNPTQVRTDNSPSCPLP